MDIEQVRHIAEEELRRNGLESWSVRFDRARRRAGKTDFQARTISLSRVLMALYDEALVREVIAHEIAHALVGPNHHHDATWRAMARRLGSSGKARLADTPAPPAPYVGVCPAGHRTERFRLPKGKRSCGQCSTRYDERFLLTWYRQA